MLRLIFYITCLLSFNISFATHTMLSDFNKATRGVHVIAEKIENELESSRNPCAHNKMCRGNPVQEPPSFVLEGAINSLQEKNRCYPHPAGLPYTRQIVLDFINKTFDIQGLSLVNLCPVNGVSDGFTKTIALLIRKNDVVISLVPTFGLHSRIVNSFGGQVVPIDVLDKDNFLPSIEELEETIIQVNKVLAEAVSTDSAYVPRVKIFNLINPSNPLGSVIYDCLEYKKYYKSLFDLACKYDFMIFEDFVYYGTEYIKNKRAMPFLAAVPEAKERVIMAFGPAKSLGCASYRAGMVVAPEWVVREMKKIVLNLNSGISVFSQCIMAAAFNPIYENAREKYFTKNAQEYALRRDVCIVGLVGEEEVLNNMRYGIDKKRMDEIKAFLRIVAYCRELQKSNCEYGFFNYIQDILHNITYSSFIDLPSELQIILYVLYEELDEQNLNILFAHFSEDIVHFNSSMCTYTVPNEYKSAVDNYVNNFLKGTQYLKLYSVPQSTFFLTINASRMIGKYALIDILEKNHTITKKETKKISNIIEKNKFYPEKMAIKSIYIKSSREINLLFSWLGNHNFIIGEQMNVSPERGLIRMSFAESPIALCNAIDSIRYVEKFIVSPNL